MKPKNKNQDEEILKEAGYSEILINYNKSGALNKVKKAISIAFEAGKFQAREETKAKVEKLRDFTMKDYPLYSMISKVVMKEKIDKIFKETSEVGE